MMDYEKIQDNICFYVFQPVTIDSIDIKKHLYISDFLVYICSFERKHIYLFRCWLEIAKKYLLLKCTV